MSKNLLLCGVYEVYAVFEWVAGDDATTNPVLRKLFASEYDAQKYRAHIINKEDLDPDVISVEEVSVDEIAEEAPTF